MRKALEMTSLETRLPPRNSTVASGSQCAPCAARDLVCDGSHPCSSCKVGNWRCYRLSPIHGTEISRKDGKDRGPVPLLRADGRPSSFTLAPIPQSLRGETGSLTSKLVFHLSATPRDPRLSFVANGGSYLKYLPRHVGVNAALDDSISCLCSMHFDLLINNETIYRTERAYVRALATLQKTLRHRKHWDTPETVAAILNLALYMIFRYVWSNNRGLPGDNFVPDFVPHLEGLSRLLNARGPGPGPDKRPKPDFDEQLFLSLINSIKPGVMLECFTQQHPCFLDDRRWNFLFLKATTQETLDQRDKNPVTWDQEVFLPCLIKVPRLMTKIATYLQTDEVDEDELTHLNNDVRKLGLQLSSINIVRRPRDQLAAEDMMEVGYACYVAMTVVIIGRLWQVLANKGGLSADLAPPSGFLRFLQIQKQLVASYFTFLTSSATFRQTRAYVEEVGVAAFIWLDAIDGAGSWTELVGAHIDPSQAFMVNE